jgi:hypothetical protein
LELAQLIGTGVKSKFIQSTPPKASAKQSVPTSGIYIYIVQYTVFSTIFISYGIPPSVQYTVFPRIIPSLSFRNNCRSVTLLITDLTPGTTGNRNTFVFMYLFIYIRVIQYLYVVLFSRLRKHAWEFTWS